MIQALRNTEEKILLEILTVWIHVLAWSVYLGGSIAMELLLRHAQNYMKGSQVSVVCQNSGKKYRWISFVCLILLMLTGWLRVSGSEIQSPAGEWILTGLVVLWVLLLCILALLAFHVHPELHIRVSASMTEAQVQHERQRVGVAIRRMDFWVRAELVLALLATLLGVVLGTMSHIAQADF